MNLHTLHTTIFRISRKIAYDVHGVLSFIDPRISPILHEISFHPSGRLSNVRPSPRKSALLLLGPSDFWIPVPSSLKLSYVFYQDRQIIQTGNTGLGDSTFVSNVIFNTK
jgi:hypothetical protein